MESAAIPSTPLTTPSKSFARRLLTIGEDRLELLMVEVQEEREHLLLTLGVALFAFLGGVARTTALVVLVSPLSLVGVLFTLTALFARFHSLVSPPRPALAGVEIFSRHARSIE